MNMETNMNTIGAREEAEKEKGRKKDYLKKQWLKPSQIWNTENTKCFWGCGVIGTLHSLLFGIQSGYSLLGKQFDSFLQI